MNCPRCETPKTDLARFCANCGAELSALILSNQAVKLAGDTGPETGTVAATPADGSEITKVLATTIVVGGGAVGAAVAPVMHTNDDEVTRVGVAVSPSEAAPVVVAPTSSGAFAAKSAPDDPLLGRTIEGKYRITSKLGAGGMGAVYRTQRLLIGDDVAVKILHPQHVSEPQATERFRREAQAAARLKHPNAVSIYDFGVTGDGLVYLVMELVEGQSLREIIKQQGPLTPSAAAEVINQVCAALDEAHRRQIVHRDLKPDNILVKPMLNGLRVKVLDFGIAKLRDLTAGNLTQTGSVMGTPHYMSPEQCLGEELDSRSDVYSLGVVLYEMLVGVVPFNSPTSTAVVVQHVNQAPASLRTMNLSISPAVEAVVLHALAKKREDRPQSAAGLANEMNAAVSSGLSAPPFPSAQTSPPSLNANQNPSPSANQLSWQGMTPTVVLRTPVAVNTETYPSHTSSIPPAYATQPQTATAGRKTTAISAAVGGLALIGVGIALYFAFFSFSAKKAILDEVRKGNLVKPQGNSAYDLYLKYKNGDLKSADADEIAREAVPPMEKRGAEVLGSLKNDQIESEDQWGEAVRLYTWLNDLRPNKTYEAKRFFSEGRLSFLRRDFDGALTSYMNSVARDATSSLTLNAIGRTYYAKRDRANTRDYYRKATMAEPAWNLPWINLGALLNEMADYAGAEAALRQAIQIDPQKPSPHNHLGFALEKMGRDCEALEEYQLAVDNAANNAGALLDVEAVRRKIGVLNAKGLICGD